MNIQYCAVQTRDKITHSLIFFFFFTFQFQIISMQQRHLISRVASLVKDYRDSMEANPTMPLSSPTPGETRRDAETSRTPFVFSKVMETPEWAFEKWWSSRSRKAYYIHGYSPMRKLLLCDCTWSLDGLSKYEGLLSRGVFKVNSLSLSSAAINGVSVCGKQAKHWLFMNYEQFDWRVADSKLHV